MLRIYHQTAAQYDSSVRIAALGVLLKNQPSAQVLRDVMLSVTDQTSAECSTYVYNSLIDAASFDTAVRCVGGVRECGWVCLSVCVCVCVCVCISCVYLFV
jgi:hypothetical protein